MFQAPAAAAHGVHWHVIAVAEGESKVHGIAGRLLIAVRHVSSSHCSRAPVPLGLRIPECAVPDYGHGRYARVVLTT